MIEYINNDPVIAEVSKMLRSVPLEALHRPSDEELKNIMRFWVSTGARIPRVISHTARTLSQLSLGGKRFTLLTVEHESTSYTVPGYGTPVVEFRGQSEARVKVGLITDAAWYHLSRVSCRATTKYAFSYGLAEQNAQVPEIAEALALLSNRLLELGLVKPRAEEAQVKRRATVSKVMDDKFLAMETRLTNLFGPRFDAIQRDLAFLKKALCEQKSA